MLATNGGRLRPVASCLRSPGHTRRPETPPDLEDSTAYGATEREQTRDVRSRNPRGDADVDLGGVSEDLEQNSDSPAD